MKKMLTVLFAVSMTAFGTNCGTSDDGDKGCTADCGNNDAGNGSTDGNDAGTTTTVDSVAPFRSPSAGLLEFSTAYIPGANCAQVRGNLPGLTWSTGADLGSEHGGYRAVSIELSAGNYEMSYVGWANCSSHGSDIWADYGLKEHLKEMTSEARRYVSCNWWNGSTIVTVSSPSCNLKIRVGNDGIITPAGNMANYDGQ